MASVQEMTARIVEIARGYQKSPLHMVAATLILRWPDMLLITETLAPPTMTEIPVGKSTKLSQLPL